MNVEVSPLALLHREAQREPEDLNADLSKVSWVIGGFFLVGVCVCVCVCDGRI